MFILGMQASGHHPPGGEAMFRALKYLHKTTVQCASRRVARAVALRQAVHG